MNEIPPLFLFFLYFFFYFFPLFFFSSLLSFLSHVVSRNGCLWHGRRRKEELQGGKLTLWGGKGEGGKGKRGKGKGEGMMLFASFTDVPPLFLITNYYPCCYILFLIFFFFFEESSSSICPWGDEKIQRFGPLSPLRCYVAQRKTKV